MTGKCDDTAVGILIPTYNRRVYLELSLASAITQSYANLEINVIDNGSTDGTAEFMEGIEDSRVKYIVNDHNLGLIGSINKGVGLFPPDVQWCTVLGDDDLLHGGFIEAMQDYVHGHNAQSIVLSHVVLINEEGIKIRDARNAAPFESAYDYLVNRCVFNRETFLTGLYFSRQAFEEIGGYPCFTTGMATDDALIFALALNDRLFYNDDSLAYIRMHAGAESHENSGMVAHIRALHDFRIYVEAVARFSQHFSQQMLSRISQAVDCYVKKLNSSFWLANVSSLLRRNGRETQDELIELYELTEDGRFQFDVRVSLYMSLHKSAVSSGVRYLFDALISMYLSLIRFSEYFSGVCQKNTWMISFWRLVSKILVRL
jgi:glycosyltransferase involved in cell wall biosynthesis